MKTIRINQVDAFTDKLFGGNPAAVVLDADGLTEDQMQQIAREMNLSETAFVLPSKVVDFKLRFFTPTSEVKFCGHATVGALYELARENMFGMENDGTYDLQVETAAGLIKMQVIKSNKETEVRFESTALNFENYKDGHQRFAQRLGIHSSAIDVRKPIILEKNLNYIYLTINSLKELEELEFNFEKIVAEFKEEGIVVFCLMTPQTFARDYQIHARGLAPIVGVNEDPVTGSMQGGLAKYALQYGLLPANTEILKVEQGNFIKRPGSLSIDVTSPLPQIVATAKHVFSTEITLEN